MDNIYAVQARIAQIHATALAPSAKPASTTATATGATFADTLAQASAANAPTGSSREAGYANGAIPVSALKPISHDHALWGSAADAFNEMKRAAAADGITLDIESSYRTYDRQVELADELGLYSQGGKAAAPGTSNHGLGVSVDLSLNGAQSAWMQANAGRFGFTADVAGEPWHWTHTASR